MKLLIKTLLREAIDKTIECKKCGWSWKESESSKNDLYVCHKCGHDNKPKTLNESLIKNNESDAKKIADFVNFSKKFLKIDDDVKVALAFELTPD
jgi:DNA-directed RNA polymerase subunit RPC12/RpoP